MPKKKKGSSRKKNQTAKRSLPYTRFLLAGIMIALVGVSISRKENLGEIPPPPPDNAPYKQPNLSVRERVEDLLSRMTLEEKIGQMSLVDKNSIVKPEDVSRYRLGAVLSGAGAKPEVNTLEGWQTMVSDIKNEADQTRLQIPLLYGIDANHGNANVPGATIFPHAIGLGASRNADLVRQVAQATSDELRAVGINWNFSPSLDAPQDIRWGRVYEAFSSDYNLNAQLGAAYIEGTQTPVEHEFVLGSAKHFLATGAMEWDSSKHDTYRIDHGIVPENVTALQSYLKPYRGAVDVGVGSVMVALTEYGGSRIIDNHDLITTKLKGELGFKGFVVSDWYGAYEYANVSNYDANIRVINAGVDMIMLPFNYKSFLKDVRKAVNEGSISQERIDDAVRRILTQKFSAGLFESSHNSPPATLGTADHKEIARKAVAGSSVLLKNRNSILPLNPSQRIHIAGTAADNTGQQSGAWTIEWQGVDGNAVTGATSILEGLRQRHENERMISYDIHGNFSQKAAVGIAVVGEKPYAEGFGDNEKPELSEEDLATISRLEDSVESVLVIIISGRPLLLPESANSWDGIIAAWLPGSEGGGIADLIFGHETFQGRLPITWLKTINQVPTTISGETRDGTPPLYERGFGMTTD